MSAARRSDRGLVMIVVALCITALLVVVALVVDLGFTRSDRRGGQVAVDNAASAAIRSLTGTDAQAACETAFGYLALTLDSAAFAGESCSKVATCAGTTTVTKTAGDFTAIVHYPVPDTSPLLQRPGTIGADGTPFLSDQPGTQCNRLGIALVTTGDAFFGSAAGQSTRATTVHAVAAIEPPPPPGRLLNLAVLERHDCAAITMAGSGGGLGGIAVGAVPRPSGGEDPGTIAVDSDASGAGCSADVGTMDVDGGNSVIRADGPPGCAGELIVGTGQGCGQIDLFAPGPPGCLAPACTSSGTVAPSPQQVADRITRAPIDHIYNCKATYPSALDIGGCGSAATRPPYIDQLTTSIGASGPIPGFQSYATAYTCAEIGPSGLPVVVPAGNWHVDCPELIVKRPVRFAGGNVVMDGDLTLESSGSFTMNDANPLATFSWVPNSSVDILRSSADAAFLYLRNGTITKQGSAAIALKRTAVYLSPSSALSFAGGTGSLSWEAPTNGPFDDLALWSDGTATHAFAGQATLTLGGAFFVPDATVTYAGQGANAAVQAQFIARKLWVSGKGLLTLKPVRGVPIITGNPIIRLIR